jgi:hypothetical protein
VDGGSDEESGGEEYGSAEGVRKAKIEVGRESKDFRLFFCDFGESAELVELVVNLQQELF